MYRQVDEAVVIMNVCMCVISVLNNYKYKCVRCIKEHLPCEYKNSYVDLIIMNKKRVHIGIINKEKNKGGIKYFSNVQFMLPMRSALSCTGVEIHLNQSNEIIETKKKFNK